MKAKDFDKKFNASEDILDVSKSNRPLQEQRRVNVDFPAWMVASLDKEASRIGITRHQLLKYGWLKD